MTTLEIEALQLKLSNHARVLYCLYLRPNACLQSQLVEIRYKDILALINSKKKEMQLGRQVNALIRELRNVGLIKLSEQHDLSKTMNYEHITLPLITSANIDDDTETKATETTSRMVINWRPHTESFEQICQLIGLIERGFSTQELGEFIAYWLGYPQRRFTQYQWTQKFVLHIKQRRLRFPIDNQQSKVGYQWVSLDADIEIDENVKRLVERYSEKHE